VTEKRMGFTHDNKDNTTVDWWTPKWVFDSLGETFDIDVAAPEGGVPWIPAGLYFTKETDGLKQDWGNCFVWCNPPYGRETGAWMRRMQQHNNGIALVFSRTDCLWFHEYCVLAEAIVFLRGRISFIDGYGATKSSGAGAGSMLVGFGERADKALRRIGGLGAYVKP